MSRTLARSAGRETSASRVWGPRPGTVARPRALSPPLNDRVAMTHELMGCDDDDDDRMGCITSASMVGKVGVEAAVRGTLQVVGSQESTARSATSACGSRCTAAAADDDGVDEEDEEDDNDDDDDDDDDEEEQAAIGSGMRCSWWEPAELQVGVSYSTSSGCWLAHTTLTEAAVVLKALVLGILEH